MAKVLVLEDLSALNQISGLAAVPLLTAQGHLPAFLPTVVLSTQTEGFGQPVVQTLDDFVVATLNHWQSLATRFDGLLLGYVGNAALLAQLQAWLQTTSCPVRLLDPVLGDEGALYPGLTPALVTAMRAMLLAVDIITPNWTELGLLVGQTWQQQPPRPRLERALRKLQRDFPRLTVVVTGIAQGGQLGCLWLAKGALRFAGNPAAPGHFYGTGDAFAALLLGYLVRNWSLEQAIKATLTGMATAVQATATGAVERQAGLQLAPLLHQLAKEGCQNDE